MPTWFYAHFSDATVVLYPWYHDVFNALLSCLLLVALDKILQTVEYNGERFTCDCQSTR